MIFIAHRGNIFGKNSSLENSINQINFCLENNINTEIDVWLIDNIYYLGHDRPEQKINELFLENTMLWCHAKNAQALFRMTQNPKIHCFWHEEDKYTITSKGIIWAYPGEAVSNNTVCVLPESNNTHISNLQNCYGICSDNIEYYSQLLCKKLLMK